MVYYSKFPKRKTNKVNLTTAKLQIQSDKYKQLFPQNTKYEKQHVQISHLENASPWMLKPSLVNTHASLPLCEICYPDDVYCMRGAHIPSVSKCSLLMKAFRGWTVAGIGNWYCTVTWFGLNIFYSSQDMIKDQAEQTAMFSPLHSYLALFRVYFSIASWLAHIAWSIQIILDVQNSQHRQYRRSISVINYF